MNWQDMLIRALSLHSKILKHEIGIKMYKCTRCGTRMTYDTNKYLICPKCDKEGFYYIPEV